jgi:hypothetical protein
MYISLEVVNVWHHVILYRYSTCLHSDPHTTQTGTQDHMMPYIDYLQADVH